MYKFDDYVGSKNVLIQYEWINIYVMKVYFG